MLCIIALSCFFSGTSVHGGGGWNAQRLFALVGRITSYNVCYTKLLRIGPFVEAWLRVHGTTPETIAEAKRRFIEPLLQQQQKTISISAK